MADGRIRRKLAALFAADVVGYSRLMGEDEVGTLAALKQCHADIIDPRITEHQGRIVKLMGDGTLAEFDSVVDSVQAAVDIQNDMVARNAEASTVLKLDLRIGIHLGDVILEGGDVFGDGVNIAARLESLAEPGGICISSVVHDAVGNKVQVRFDYTGEQKVKNIVKPLRTFHFSPKSANLSIERRDQAPNTPVKTGRPTLIVLPFALRGVSEEFHFLGDCLAEELIDSLSRSRSLFMIAADSSREFKDSKPRFQDIYSQLGARYIVHGVISQFGNRFRVNIQLSDGETGMLVSTVKIEKENNDLFDVIDEFSGKIAGELLPNIAIGELNRIRRSHHSDLNSWGLYFRALPLLRKQEEAACQEAIEHLKRSLEMSSDFAAALARLAACHVQAGYYQWHGKSTAEHLSNAFAYAERALSTDADEPLAYDALASAHQLAKNPEAAVSFAEKAIDISATCTSAYGTLITALAMLGRGEEALSLFETCKLISPRDPDRSGTLMGVIISHYLAGNYEKAIQAARDHLVLRPNWFASHQYISAAAAMIGDHDQAARSIAQLLELQPDYTLKKHRERTSLRQASDIEHLQKGLAAAGLPSGEEALDD